MQSSVDDILRACGMQDTPSADELPDFGIGEPHPLVEEVIQQLAQQKGDSYYTEPPAPYTPAGTITTDVDDVTEHEPLGDAIARVSIHYYNYII